MEKFSTVEAREKFGSIVKKAAQDKDKDNSHQAWQGVGRAGAHGRREAFGRPGRPPGPGRSPGRPGGGQG